MKRQRSVIYRTPLSFALPLVAKMKLYNKANVRVISGNSNIPLAKKITDHLNIDLTPCKIETFSNTETKITLGKSVRGKHIYIVQTGGFNHSQKKSINDYIMETLLIMDATRRSGAKSISLLMPCFPYARQDKKDSPRAPISASMLAKVLQACGLSRIVCVDLHAASIQGFFQGACDNLYCVKPITEFLCKQFLNDPVVRDNVVAIAPDEGAIKRVRIYASNLSLKFLVMSKVRNYEKTNVVEETILLGDKTLINGKIVLLFDDMIDTAGTIVKSAEHLQQYGMKEAVIIASHGILSGPAIERINNCDAISTVLISDSLPQEENCKKCDKLRVFSISEMYAEVVCCLTNGNSVSNMFKS